LEFKKETLKRWRRQLWGTGECTPLDFQQFNNFFQLTSELHKVLQRLSADVSPNICTLQQQLR